MEETGEQHAKWNKPVTKKQILYHFTKVGRFQLRLAPRAQSMPRTRTTPGESSVDWCLPVNMVMYQLENSAFVSLPSKPTAFLKENFIADPSCSSPTYVWGISGTHMRSQPTEHLKQNTVWCHAIHWKQGICFIV